MRVKEALKNPVKNSEYFLHETKKNVLLRFFVVVGIVVFYFVFVSFEYGIKDGIMATFITWSFFVFCTPIADAGFLLDFPIRLITKIKMIYSEIGVWVIGFLINLFAFIFMEDIYEKTEILKLFKHIILTPYPFWSIIILSAIGTFLSISFGDELIDVVKHSHRKKYQKHRKKYIFFLFVFLVVFTILLYLYLLKTMGINIPL